MVLEVPELELAVPREVQSVTDGAQESGRTTGVLELAARREIVPRLLEGANHSPRRLDGHAVELALFHLQLAGFRIVTRESFLAAFFAIEIRAMARERAFGFMAFRRRIFTSFVPLGTKVPSFKK